MKPEEPDHRRVFIALLLASLVLFAWQAKVEWPRRQQLAHMQQQQAVKHEVEAKQAQEEAVKAGSTEEGASLTWQQRIAQSSRIAVESDMLHGSIALKGARFDDLTLVKYKESLDPDSDYVTLFSPPAAIIPISRRWVLSPKGAKSKSPTSIRCGRPIRKRSPPAIP